MALTQHSRVSNLCLGIRIKFEKSVPSHTFLITQFQSSAKSTGKYLEPAFCTLQPNGHTLQYSLLLIIIPVCRLPPIYLR